MYASSYITSEQLKRQKRMGEHTTKFAMEINGAVARASEKNCA
jgi:hypothetical protein